MDIIGAETLKRMDRAVFYNNSIFHLAKPYMNGHILEVGCGVGSFTKKLAKLGDVTAVDIDKHYISKTKKELGPLATVGFGDIEHGKFFFKEGIKFNSIICLNVLEHIKDDKRALKNMSNLLKKGGQIFLLTPAMPGFYGKLDRGLGHERRYLLNELAKSFEEAGLKVDAKYYYNILGGIGWYVNGKILKRKILPSNQLKVFLVLSRLTLLAEKFVKPPFGLSCVIVASK